MEYESKNAMLRAQLMNLDAVRSVASPNFAHRATVNIRGNWKEIPQHLFRVAELFDLTVIWRSTERGGLGYEVTVLELADEERTVAIERYCEKHGKDYRILE